MIVCDKCNKLRNVEISAVDELEGIGLDNDLIRCVPEHKGRTAMSYGKESDRFWDSVSKAGVNGKVYTEEESEANRKEFNRLLYTEMLESLAAERKAIEVKEEVLRDLLGKKSKSEEFLEFLNAPIKLGGFSVSGYGTYRRKNAT
jgi:hypothetical protein